MDIWTKVYLYTPPQRGGGIQQVLFQSYTLIYNAYNPENVISWNSYSAHQKYGDRVT